MNRLTIALAAAGLLTLSGAYAADDGDTGTAPSSGVQSQQNKQSGGSTTHHSDQGSGQSRGSNEGGTGRHTTAQQPTSDPGATSTRDPNRGAGVGSADDSQSQDSSAERPDHDSSGQGAQGGGAGNR